MGTDGDAELLGQGAPCPGLGSAAAAPLTRAGFIILIALLSDIHCTSDLHVVSRGGGFFFLKLCTKLCGLAEKLKELYNQSPFPLPTAWGQQLPPLKEENMVKKAHSVAFCSGSQDYAANTAWTLDFVCQSLSRSVLGHRTTQTLWLGYQALLGSQAGVFSVLQRPAPDVWTAPPADPKVKSRRLV